MHPRHMTGIFLLAIALGGAALVFGLRSRNEVVMAPIETAPFLPVIFVNAMPEQDSAALPEVATSTDELHLLPPAVARGIYLTGWTAGSAARRPSLLALLQTRRLNTVIIDIKDYSGYLSYKVDHPLVAEIGANRNLKMGPPEDLIAALHERGVYVIGRLTVFQDPVLAAARPEWVL